MRVDSTRSVIGGGLGVKYALRVQQCMYLGTLYT